MFGKQVILIIEGFLSITSSPTIYELLEKERIYQLTNLDSHYKPVKFQYYSMKYKDQKLPNKNQ